MLIALGLAALVVLVASKRDRSPEQREDEVTPSTSHISRPAVPAGPAWLSPAPAAIPITSVAGVPSVVDGDTLVVAGQTLRLDGVDALETDQPCTLHGRQWACGAQATRELGRFLEGRLVQCRLTGRDRYERLLALCEVAGQDIGAWLVRHGWAVAYTRYSQRYVAQEAEARRAQAGIWAGRFETPEDWRRRQAR